MIMPRRTFSLEILRSAKNNNEILQTFKGFANLSAILACMDSRTPIEIIFNQGIGDVFGIRIAGNIVNEDILGSLEFASKVAGSKLIIVLGHTSCGAIKGACDNVQLGNLTGLLARIMPAVAAVPNDGTDRTSRNYGFVEKVADRNVHITVQQIREQSPILKEMEDKDEIMIVGAMLTSLVIAREYENGTMETIKSLPITAGEFLLGKAIPYFFIALTDVLIAMLMGQILFGVILKSSFWLMILASSLYIAVALTLGLLISVITKSQLVANQAAVLVTYLPSLLLSNFVFPVANMPKVLQLFTSIVPATYYIKILSGIYLKNLGLTHLWPSLLVLLVMFVILAAANCVLLKKEGL
jgi:carbonic anhydrase